VQDDHVWHWGGLHPQPILPRGAAIGPRNAQAAPPLSESHDAAGLTRQNAEIKIRKIPLSKIANRKKEKLKNFHRNLFHEIDREIVSRKIVSLFSRSTARLFTSSLLVVHSQCARCKLNGQAVSL
jgi:hypothetical protein